MTKKNLKDFTLEELNEFLKEMGEPNFRAKQVFEWLYRGVSSFDEMSNLSKTLREKLQAAATVGNIQIAQKLVSKIDGTRKYLLKLDDGNFIESVLMKYKHGYTICISSQVGCRMGCAFCASTRNGRVRNLTAGEIIGQVLAVQGDLKERISNIVMMGIGEPLDNYGNVLKFLENINHPNGLNIGQRHISLSTCGIVPKIKDLADRDLQITLSISLHAVTNAARTKIMPVNKKYPIETLLDACRYYIRKTNRRISFEYTLISGVNDSIADAEALAALLHGMLCHVNLIPVNTVKETGFTKSSPARIERFRQKLEKSGIPATVRREMGADINAACGQLRNNAADAQNKEGGVE